MNNLSPVWIDIDILINGTEFALINDTILEGNVDPKKRDLQEFRSDSDIKPDNPNKQTTKLNDNSKQWNLLTVPAILLVEQPQPLTTLKNLHEKKTFERYQTVKQTQESKALAVTSELINHPPQLLTALIELEMTEMSTHTEKQFKPVLCYKALQDSCLNI